MNKQRKVLIIITYNEMGIIIDTKAEEVAQPNSISPVNPQEPKTGYWIGVDGKPSYLQDGMTTGSVWCSECGIWLTASDEYSCNGKYCPKCGAKMQEVEE